MPPLLEIEGLTMSMSRGRGGSVDDNTGDTCGGGGTRSVDEGAHDMCRGKGGGSMDEEDCGDV